MVHHALQTPFIIFFDFMNTIFVSRHLEKVLLEYNFKSSKKLI